MESTSTPLRQRVSAEERSRLVSLFRGSGLTRAEFAQEHGLKLGTFQQWLYRKEPKKKSSPRFQEFPAASFLSSSWAAEIVLGSGQILRLKESVSADWIASVLTVLHSHSC